MREPKNRSNEPAGADMASLSLMITAALFMALLAFLIVLNAFSSDSASKLAIAKNSLINSFGFMGLGQSPDPSNEQGLGNAGQMEEATVTGLRSVLPDLGFQARRTSSGGQMMVVVIPKDDLDERWPALRSRLAELMQDRNASGYVMQMLSLDGAAQASSLASLAQGLAEDGVDEGMISIGYESRGQASVEFRFVLGNAR